MIIRLSRSLAGVDSKSQITMTKANVKETLFSGLLLII